MYFFVCDSLNWNDDPITGNELLISQDDMVVNQVVAPVGLIVPIDNCKSAMVAQ